MGGATRTGKTLEDMCRTALLLNGYVVHPQAYIGQKIGGGRHKVDLIAEVPEGLCLISLKWQQVSGTAQEKIPFEIIKLIYTMQINDGVYLRAHLVLGGEGWTPSLKEFYVSDGLAQFIRGHELVSVHTFEGFVALANKQEI